MHNSPEDGTRIHSILEKYYLDGEGLSEEDQAIIAGFIEPPYIPDPDDLHAVVNYDEDMEEFDFTCPIITEPGEDVIAAVERHLFNHCTDDDMNRAILDPPITTAQWWLSKVLWLMAGGCWVIAIGSIIYWWQP